MCAEKMQICESQNNPDATYTICCPGCGRMFNLEKVDNSWDCLSLNEALAVTTGSPLLALMIMVICREVAVKCLGFSLSVLHLAGVLFTCAVVFVFIGVTILSRHREKAMKKKGIEIWEGACDCQSSFTIVRHIKDSEN